MGDRVWQVQKELEDLQARVGGADSEVPHLTFDLTGSRNNCPWPSSVVVSEAEACI